MATNPFPLDTAATLWVQKTLDSLTLKHQIGQLLMPGTNCNGETPLERTEERYRLLEELGVGSFRTTGGQAEKLLDLHNSLQAKSSIPLLIATDLEYGAGHTSSNATRFPIAMGLSAANALDRMFEVGRAVAEEARAMGVHWMFNPVCDVNINPDNPIINVRSFGEDVIRVSDYISAFIRGVQEQKAIACAKHFPGHGDTVSDSHRMMPYVRATRERLEKVEFPPFIASIEAGVGSMMTSHICYPEMTQEEGEIPATMSWRLMTQLLRNEWGFEGLLITDSMRMRGVRSSYSPAEAAVATIQAGVDCILTPPDVDAAHNAIFHAVEEGIISEQQIENSVRRILSAKAWLGLHKESICDSEKMMEILQKPETVKLSRQLAQESITVINDEQQIIPVKPSQKTKVLQLAFFDQDRFSRPRKAEFVQNDLSEYFGQVEIEFISAKPKGKHFAWLDENWKEEPKEKVVDEFGALLLRREKILERCEEFDLVITTVHSRTKAYAKGTHPLSEGQLTLLENLKEITTPHIVVVLGSPYLLKTLPVFSCQLVTYDWSRLLMKQIAGAIVGKFPLVGELPIQPSSCSLQANPQKHDP